MSGPYQGRDLSNCGVGRLRIAINCGVLSVNNFYCYNYVSYQIHFVPTKHEYKHTHKHTYNTYIPGLMQETFHELQDDLDSPS